MPEHNIKDITDDLTEDQLQELISLCEEPAEKDTISEEEYKILIARWSTNSTL